MSIQNKILILLLIFLLPSCSDSVLDTHTDTEIDTEVEEDLENEELVPFSYLALGDSYTIGQGVEQIDRWPVQLQAELAHQDIIIDTLKIIAQTGWTTANLLEAIDQEIPGTYDMVSLLIGVNNQYQGLPFTQFESEFNLLLMKAMEFSGGNDNILVVSIPDYGVTPFGSSNSTQIAMELDDYNAYVALQCSSFDIPFINITEISRTLGAGSNALAGDNLHPSAFQYSLWVNEILPVAKDILEN